LAVKLLDFDHIAVRPMRLKADRTPGYGRHRAFSAGGG
jgi:hypothetical protein